MIGSKYKITQKKRWRSRIANESQKYADMACFVGLVMDPGRRMLLGTTGIEWTMVQRLAVG